MRIPFIRNGAGRDGPVWVRYPLSKTSLPKLSITRCHVIKEGYSTRPLPWRYMNPLLAWRDFVSLDNINQHQSSSITSTGNKSNGQDTP